MQSIICPSPRQRIPSVNSSPASPHTTELHHRALQQAATPQMLHPSSPSFVKQAIYGDDTPITPPLPVQSKEDSQPKLFGLPLKYVSLITLAVQNATLTIIMHYSRIITPPSRTYSAASAVLLNELLKGSISMIIALMRIDPDDRKSRSSLTSVPQAPKNEQSFIAKSKRSIASASPKRLQRFASRWRRLAREVFSSDCWKLSIPAILYVIQNNLQYVAASNLDVATFQVTYQMKILTTAAFSVVMLRKKLTLVKWLSLLGLALGVGIVQIQTGSAAHAGAKVVEVVSEELSGDAATEEIVKEVATHVMNPLKGFLAVSAACMTSGLAGVYFEMVLKGSQADLWVRNVQLSLFSLLPALVPIIFSSNTNPASVDWFREIFKNFGGWAWATVAIQVFGGLVTAVVIKYSDNIMKGFATSLSIVISFLASVALFDFSITVPFVVGCSVVLGATWFYNAPDKKPIGSGESEKDAGYGLADLKLGSRRPSSTIGGSPIGADAPILGETTPKRRSPFPTPRSIANALGRVVGSRASSANTSPTSENYVSYPTPGGGINGGPLLTPGNGSGLGSPWSSAPPSRRSSQVNMSRNGSLGGGFDAATLVAGNGHGHAPRTSSDGLTMGVVDGTRR